MLLITECLKRKKIPGYFLNWQDYGMSFAYRYCGSISFPSLPHIWIRLPTVLLSTFMPDFLYPFNSPFPTGINCAIKRIRPSFLKCILVISGSLNFYPETPG